MPVDVLAKFAGSITDTIRRGMHGREFLDLCEARGGGRWTLSLAKVPQDLQTNQTMRHLMSNFAWQAAREAGNYRDHLSDEPDLIQIQGDAQESTEAPFYEVHQFNPVNRYYSIIERAARRFEVDPNSIRAIMYVETTHGYYDAPLSWLSVNRSIWNVHASFWSCLVYKHSIHLELMRGFCYRISCIVFGRSHRTARTSGWAMIVIVEYENHFAEPCLQRTR
jgi:hypothetical protein